MEFLALTQGSMTVGEYTSKFEELSCFHPHYHNATDDRSRCVKFINGLRPEIKEAIKMQEIRHFPTLVNRCRIFEEDHKDRIAKARSYGPQRFQRKGFEKKKPYQHPQRHQSSSSGAAKKPQSAGNSYTPAAITLKCFECGEPHLKRDSPTTKKVITCFGCNQSGHILRDCPLVKKEKKDDNNSKGNNNNNKNNNSTGGKAGRPKTTSKVFTMSGEEAVKSKSMRVSALCVRFH